MPEFYRWRLIETAPLILPGRMPSIFISYRRSDSQADAGRIYDRLAQHFGREAIFKDVDDIPGGEDFRIFLQNTLQQCKVLLAIIGPDWVNALDGQGRRWLDNLADWVRMEIEESLNRNDVLVLPVLVSNAAMPRMDELPDRMQNLVYRNYRLARPDPDFHKDVSRLIIDLEQHVKQTMPPNPWIETAVDTSQQKLEQYRGEVRHCSETDKGVISPISRSILERLRIVFAISAEEAETVEQEELQPYRAKAEAIDSYRKVFADALRYEMPPSQGTRERLERFQKTLKLSNGEVQEIEAPLFQALEEQKKDYLEKINHYEQAYQAAVEAEYPLSQKAIGGLKSLQQQLGLQKVDADKVEQPILEVARVKYQYAVEEANRQRQEAATIRKQREGAENRRKALEAEANRRAKAKDERRMAETRCQEVEMPALVS